MKNPTAKKPARKTPRSKDAQRVDRVLDAMKAAPKKGETVLNFDSLSGAEVQEALDVAKANSKPADVKKAAKEISDSNKAAAAPKTELTRGMIGKVRRAHRKAGVAQPTEAVLEAFARTLLTRRGADHGAL
jgi:hypothetical protein